VEIIKKTEEDKKNEHLGVFLPNEYEGPLNFESLYEWLYDKWEEHEKQKSQNSGDDDNEDGDEDGQGEGKGQGQGQGQGKPSYGKFGKNGLECDSLESIFDNMQNNDGQFMDVHIDDEVADDQKREYIKHVTEGLKARGLTQGNMETILNKLQKKRKDYLREIKRQIASNIMGSIKNPTITRPNRKGIFGLKGKKKVKTVINCLLDTSGSMGSDFDKVLSYIFQNDIEINLVQCDTQVQHSVVVKNKKDLEKMKIKGLGGTTLQPGVDYIAQNHNQFNTVILTDGYTDSFDFTRLKGNVLIISSGVECPIAATNKRVKQILIEKETA
jgi:predicted metal-dependent peptidase